MVGNSYVNSTRSTEVSLDIDFAPYRKSRVQDSAIGSRETAPMMTTELMLDCDVDRITKHFEERSTK